MIEVKNKVRKAYIDKLAPVKLNNVSIPIYQEIVNSTKTKTKIQGTPVIDAYIIVGTQTVDDDSAKCGVNQNTSIQLDVVTVFEANSGGSLYAEQITDDIYSVLYPNGGNKADITIDGLNVWKSTLAASRIIHEEFASYRIFRNVLIFNHSISQP